MHSTTVFTLGEITTALSADNIEFLLTGKTRCQEFSFMSLREVHPGGLFYVKGNVAQSVPFKDSVILSDQDMSPPPNCVVLRVQNPQLSFYRLMNRLVGSTFDQAPGVHPTAVIGPDVKIDPSVSVGPFCHLEGCEIGAGSILGSHVSVLHGSRIAKDVVIESQSVIGARGVAWVWDPDRNERVLQPQIGFSTIDRGTFLGANTIVVRGSVNETTKVGSNCVIAPGARIGHGCDIGDECHFANNIAVGGNSVIGRGSFLGVACAIRPQVALAPNTLVAAGAVVVKNCLSEGKLLVGIPAVEKDQKEGPHSGVPVRR